MSHEQHTPRRIPAPPEVVQGPSHPTTPPSGAPRRAGRITAALSLVMLTAVGSAVAAPGAFTEPATTASAQPTEAATVAMSAEERAALAGRADRSARTAAVPASAARSTTSAKPTARAATATPEVVGSRYATTALKVRASANADSRVVAVLDRGAKVSITDQRRNGYRQISHKGTFRWVKADFLSTRKPTAASRSTSSGGGLSSAACPSGSGGSAVEGGLTRNAIAVHRAVCARFPSVSSYGGIRGGGGNHGQGRALDIMVRGATGDRIAAFLRANARALGVTEVIWEQRIWTVQRASEGWRPMPDRGSATANHYDHVHVSVR